METRIAAIESVFAADSNPKIPWTLKRAKPAMDRCNAVAMLGLATRAAMCKGAARQFASCFE
jgi:hypothetical protein